MGREKKRKVVFGHAGALLKSTRIPSYSITVATAGTTQKSKGIPVISLSTKMHLDILYSKLPVTANLHNDGRDAFLVMSSAYYDRTCLWSADIFTSVWQEKFLFL